MDGRIQEKLVTADEAVKVIKSGDWVEHAFGVAGANELMLHWLEE